MKLGPVRSRRRRVVAIERDGRHVVLRPDSGGEAATHVDVIDALGTDPRRRIETDGIYDFACVGDELWIVGDGGVRRWSLADGAELSHTTVLLPPGYLSHAEPGRAAWVCGAQSLVLALADDIVTATTLERGAIDLAFAAPGAKVALARDRTVEMIGAPGSRGGVIPGDGEVTAGSSLFGGRVLALLSEAGDKAAFDVLQPSGALVHHIDIDSPTDVAFAEQRGVAIVLTGGDRLVAVDLRYGRVVGKSSIPIEAVGIAIDADGRHVVAAGHREGDAPGERLSLLHMPYTDLFGGKVTKREASPTNGAAAAPPTDAALSEADDHADDDDAADDGPIEIPDTPLVAIAPRRFSLEVDGETDAPPYDHAAEHLDDIAALVAASAGVAIAQAWNSGRLSVSPEDELPYQREVIALTGQSIEAAQNFVEASDRRFSELSKATADRVRATLAAGTVLPLLEIAQQFELSPMAVQILSAVAASQVRGEVARLFGILVNDTARSTCDLDVIQRTIGKGDIARRNAIAEELSPSAPLRRHGLVTVAPAPAGGQLFAALTVDAAVLDRLRAVPQVNLAGAVAVIEQADRELSDLALPARIKRDAVVALSATPRPDRPMRLVVTGRAGLGRTTLLASLAARADLPLCVIDAERLPRGAALAPALRVELHRATLRGALPCVSGLEFASVDDSSHRDHVREVFRGFPGPVTFRGSPDCRLPIDPGFVRFDLPAPTESERLAFWRRCVADYDLEVGNPQRLASRFRVGPGTIQEIVRSVAERADDGAGDQTEALDRAARQHISNRLSTVSSKVDRLATWNQVALPEDVVDSVREFIGRVQHRRTVYDDWGFDEKVSSSRGLTALFYGPPGTGKTMVAGLIARELGLDMYRVDLARIISKWIGETEKNLAEVFDAAEDGQAVILFDEADSLFAKRTEVKSSVDRYANLEVNYLLQRLDSFEGVAILTTNLEGSIDGAFKRRMSLRLAFPFPDEEMRVRLWAAHIPTQVPNAGDFEFDQLARRYPMSGGFIRNSALRAAFLAAQEGVPLSHNHLERAIQLEYREMGKLSTTSRMQ